jgi:hypothetical protein
MDGTGWEGSLWVRIRWGMHIRDWREIFVFESSNPHRALRGVGYERLMNEWIDMIISMLLSLNRVLLIV